MKKRILSFALALCTVLSLIPFTALGVFASGVDGVYYDSPYARDVVFGDVPVTSWYTGLGGTLYEENAFGLATDYASYMTAFDTMAGFGDLIAEAGEENGDTVYEIDEENKRITIRANEALKSGK